MPHSYTPATQRYKTVGRCIYCGANENSAKLTDEHIVAISLGGYWVLPDASCEQCGKITSYIEGYVTKNVYGAYRHVNQLPTRRPKDRPKRLPLEIVFPDHKESRDMNVDDHPGAFVAVALNAPGMFRGPRPGDPFGEVTYIVFQRTFKTTGLPALFQATGAKSVVQDLHLFKIDVFARMLAKVAHAAAVAHLGLDGFSPFLPPLILQKAEQLPYYIGGDRDLAPPSNKNTRHLIEFRRCQFEGKPLLVTSIRLFSSAGCPTYHVVTGALPPNPN